MATYYFYQCNSCDFKFSTSEPHEFLYQNSELIQLPHPSWDGPCSGLFANAYCPTCKEEKKVIIVEYIDENVRNPFESVIENIKPEFLKNYSGYMKDYPQSKRIPTESYNYSALICPTCMNQVFCLPFQTLEQMCPKCTKGKIEKDKARGSYMT